MSRDAVVLLVLVFALLAIGLVMLYSATAVTAEKSPRYHDAAYFLKRQLLWVGISIAAMIVAARIPTAFWARHGLTIFLLTTIFLCLVFVPGIGAQLNGARRWVRAGSFFLQPSEAAKVGIAVFLCGYAAKDPERMRRFFRGFLPGCATIAVVCALILVEPDVGTALFVALVMGLTLFVAGVRIFHVVPVGVAAGGFLAFYALTHTEHVQKRLHDWGTGYQIKQSLTALGTGGWAGVGLGRGTSKLYFLPEAHSDFIFPVIGEELGFLGAAAILVLYLAIGLVGLRIMRRSANRFGSLLSFALTAYIILQAAMNVAVVTAAVPTKGIPLPFVSAGGSSVLFTMVGVGMLVSVANAAEREAWREGDLGSCSPGAAPAGTSFPA